MDWFLYDNGLRHERVNSYALRQLTLPLNQTTAIMAFDSYLIFFSKKDSLLSVIVTMMEVGIYK